MRYKFHSDNMKRQQQYEQRKQDNIKKNYKKKSDEMMGRELIYFSTENGRGVLL